MGEWNYVGGYGDLGGILQSEYVVSRRSPLRKELGEPESNCPIYSAIFITSQSI
jgi:hypothetical protein